MDGLPVKRTAAKLHECKTCGLEIMPGEECYTVAQRQYPSRKFNTMYLCDDCGEQYIDKLLAQAKRELAMIEASK
jgi:predicted RNA-binding Zn-ribbon protein involved in translation (DUF1610 family)